VVGEITDEGITVLLVEQNVAVALELADTVHVLDRRRIVFSGPPEKLERDGAILDRHLGVSI